MIGAKVKDLTWSKTYPYEQLAVADQGDGTYMICCIPFALYDLCLGDYVTIDDEMNAKEVVRKSDYVGFRVATISDDTQRILLDHVQSVHYEVEIYSGRLTALATENAIDGKKLATILRDLEDKRIITEYETIDPGLIK